MNRPKNVLFINVPHISFNSFIDPYYNAKSVRKADGKLYGNVLTDMPLGLLSLSSYIKHSAKCTPSISLIDFNTELVAVPEFPFQSYYEYFKSYLDGIVNDYDIIGVSSLFSTSYQSLIELGDALREKWPNKIILAGGPVPSGSYREIFRDTKSYDALCYGEAEKPLLELIEVGDEKLVLAMGSSWITNDKVDRGEQFSHNVIDDLDEIPFYDYDLVDAKKYGLNPAITAYHGVTTHERNFHFITSLGCPFKCTFCASWKVHGRRMRYWSVDRVKQDLIGLKEKFSAKTIVIQDDHFMGDPERALEIVKILGSLGLKVVFQNGLAMYALGRKFLEALKNAGVEQLLLSIESGNKDTLRLMKKPLKLDIVERVVADCRELGIYTNANILIGMPGETSEDIEVTRKFLKTISPNWFMIFVASPLVGSEMYEEAVEKGYLKEGFVGGADFKRAVIQTEDWDQQYIQEVTYILNLEMNFVNNSDMRLGNYSLALRGLENAIRARADHALAYYYGGICHGHLGHESKYHAYMEKVANILKASEFWQNVFVYFNLEIIEDIPEHKIMLDNVVPTYFPPLGPELKNIFGVG